MAWQCLHQDQGKKWARQGTEFPDSGQGFLLGKAFAAVPMGADGRHRLDGL
jgi:hypothetical protein